MEPPPSPWKKPNEVMQLHKLKKRKKALQERMRQPSASSSEESNIKSSKDLDFSRVLEREKRINPFSKNTCQPLKKSKLDLDTEGDESNDKTLFAILNLPARVPDKAPQDVDSEKLSTFSNLLQKYTADHTLEAKPLKNTSKHVPVDWGIKTKVRIMSLKPFPWKTNLKACEEASGIAGFVRCLDPSSPSALDTSPRAELHRHCLYWTHPALPWLSPFPRHSQQAKLSPGFMASMVNNEEVKQALFNDWTESFRSLFQLLRALHCPYFYVCAQAFTCLFRAAGVCGPDASVLVAPTSRGFRRMLAQADIEFTMPLRPDKRRLNTSDDDSLRAASSDSCYDSMLDDGASPDAEAEEDAGDEDPDQFLSRLGFETEVIKKINNAQARISNSTESSVDRAGASLVAVRGGDVHALFDLLLNCRSLSAGAPPALLAPAPFAGASLRALQVRSSTVQSDGRQYHSLELSGPVLPSALHGVLAALRRRHAATLSLTLAGPPALSRLDAGAAPAPPLAFAASNLADCGLPSDTLRALCQDTPTALDALTYDADTDTYSW